MAFCFSMRAGNCSLRPARSAVQYRAHRGVRCAHVCPGTPPPRDPFEGAFLVSCFAETSEPGLRRVESDRETTSLGLHYCSEGSVRALDDGEDAFARGCRGLIVPDWRLPECRCFQQSVTCFTSLHFLKVQMTPGNGHQRRSLTAIRRGVHVTRFHAPRQRHE